MAFKIWKVTIKETLLEKPLKSTYVGDVDYEFIKCYYGCEQSDVEWYTIEEAERIN